MPIRRILSQYPPLQTQDSQTQDSQNPESISRSERRRPAARNRLPRGVQGRDEARLPPRPAREGRLGRGVQGRDDSEARLPPRPAGAPGSPAGRRPRGGLPRRRDAAPTCNRTPFQLATGRRSNLQRDAVPTCNGTLLRGSGSAGGGLARK